MPHRFLRGIPYWALASIRHLDVQVAPSLGHWMSWRTRVVTLTKSAIVVGNPTLDLPRATAEAQSVAAGLSTSGYDVRLLVEAAATGEAVRGAARNAGILHFAGHGFSKPMEPLLSSLLLHPSPRWQSAGDDPLRRLASDKQDWTPVGPGMRHTSTAFGRLVERYDQAGTGEVWARRLEYSTHDTLWGQYSEGRLVRLAELWTSSSMLIDDSLARCALAFLCACETNTADLGIEFDEAGGLPSSLEVNGVGTVICTQWPVDDAAALVFALLFYEELRAAHEVFDVRCAVRRCRSRLEVMNHDQVAALLQSAQGTTSGVIEQYRDIMEREGLSRTDRPFAHPLYWAAFTYHGAEHLDLKGT